jgi:hypothetical protein
VDFCNSVGGGFWASVANYYSCRVICSGSKESCSLLADTNALVLVLIATCELGFNGFFTKI